MVAAWRRRLRADCLNLRGRQGTFHLWSVRDKEIRQLRPVRYNVAASLDGYIAGPDGGIDWIPDDPTVDFGALFARVDTVVMGRRSYEAVLALGGGAWPPGARVVVCSATLDPAAHPEVEVERGDPVARMQALRADPGDGEIWLFGGGALFASLLAAGQVDAVEVTVVPVLLGGGVPLVGRIPVTRLALADIRRYPSGMVTLSYEVPGASS